MPPTGVVIVYICLSQPNPPHFDDMDGNKLYVLEIIRRTRTTATEADVREIFIGRNEQGLEISNREQDEGSET